MEIMKFSIKKYLTVLLTVAMITSCTDEIIDIDPENAVTPEIALARVSGINALILSSYRRMHEFTYNGQNQLLNAEALADNLVIANNTGRYTGQVVNTVNSHFGTWGAAPWNIINECNTVLKYADAASPALATSGTLAGLPESEAATVPKRARYKGEAFFLRAFSYHNLVKVYGYEPGMEVGGFDLGVILRTNPTEGASDADKRARSTNDEVYAQIVSDLLAAIPLLPAEADFVAAPGIGQWPIAEKYFRASKPAAKALLARVYLYMGDFANADATAVDAMDETRGLVTAANYVASWSQSANAANSEAIYEAEIRVADWSSVDGVNNSMASITNSSPTGASNAQFAVAGSDELIAAFEAGDVRRNMWVNNAGRHECKKWPGEKGNFLENIPLLRVSELYLISAEARARSGNDAGAQTQVNALRAVRGLAATALTGAALQDLILNERRVEFAFEGHRWFDLKRLGKDIVKPASLGVSDVPYTDFRILANIPNAEVIFNELLVQNPNY
jgi:hypothetical protein